MSREKQASKNIIIAFIYFILSAVLSFISKSMLIRILGIEYSGLNSLFTDLIGVLSVSELGASAAVGFHLFRPLAEKNHKRINEILQLFKYFYRAIALLIVVIGLILTPFLQNFITSSIDITTVRISWILFLVGTASSYLFSYINVLPTADQKNYLVVRTQSLIRFAKVIIGIASLVVLKNYYIWLAIEILGNLLGFVVIHIQTRHRYPYVNVSEKTPIKTLIKRDKKVIKTTGDYFFHRIGALFVNQTDNILISAFCTLTDVGMYGNYLSIFNIIGSAVEQVYGGLIASFGNLIIEKKEKSAYQIWREIHIMTVFAAVIICFIFYECASSFVSVWVGAEFQLAPIIVAFITLNLAFRLTKQPIDRFKEAFGIVWDRMSPIVESAINLIVSVIAALLLAPQNLQVLGVVIGTVVSNLVITIIWKPIVTFKHGFKINFREYLKLNVWLIPLAVATFFAGHFLFNLVPIPTVTGWGTLAINMIFATVLILAISFVCFIVSPTFRVVFRKYLNIGLRFIKTIFKRKRDV